MIGKYLFKFVLTILLIVSTFFQVKVDAVNLKFVKSFGSGNDDFLFRRISGAVLSKNKNIYVIDIKVNSLLCYDWNGKLIKKIGKRGAGPGDFNLPIGLNLFENKLWISDMFNRRIAEVDMQLNEIKYHKIYSGESFSDSFFVVDKNKCVGPSISFSLNFEKEYKIIKYLNFDTQLEEMFFDRVPVKGLSPKQITKNRLWPIIYSPTLGIDRENKNLIISFSRPQNPIEFFVYSYYGLCRDQFTCNFDETYEYPDYYLTGKNRPKEFQALILHSIFVHKGNYIVFLSKTKYKGRELDADNYCLIIDQKTKQLKHKLSIPKFLEFYSISEEGYLLGTKNFQDDLQVFVYKLEL